MSHYINTLQNLNYVRLVLYTAAFQKMEQSVKVRQNCYLVLQNCTRPCQPGPYVDG